MVMTSRISGAVPAALMIFSVIFLPEQMTAFLPVADNHRYVVSSGNPKTSASMLRSAVSDDEEQPNKSDSSFSRRDVLQKVAGSSAAAVAATSSVLPPFVAWADDVDDVVSEKKAPPVDTPFSASWSAVAGLNSLDDKSQFVAFDYGSYKAMRDDPTRTPIFQKAISKRLGKNPESQVVLDLGTGPFALFALIAAELGAGKVYAIEANPRAAASARMFVKRAGFDDVITIVEGFSQDIQLPEKADFCVAEICGSIASEEGVFASVCDAHRLLKDPKQASSWIPSRIQTYAAPASYTLHNLFGPPEFDWTKLNGEPVRFSCRDKGLELLADPQLVEDISFPDIIEEKEKGGSIKKVLTFTVDRNRIQENRLALFDEFRRDNKSTVQESQDLAIKTASSMSGIALWPRLFLDDSTIIDSRRYGDGGHQKSHWQTVLPIVSGRPLADLAGGERIYATCDFDLPLDVKKPPVYTIRGLVKYT